MKVGSRFKDCTINGKSGYGPGKVIGTKPSGRGPWWQVQFKDGSTRWVRQGQVTR